MKRPQHGIALLVAAAFALPAAAQSPGQPVAPKQRFGGSVLEAHAPDSEGWILTGAGRNGIAFGKRGTAPGETFGAQVVLFEMPPSASGEEFVAVVRDRVAVANPPPRFEEIASEYQYTESRGYPCANVRVSYDDTEASTPAGKERLRLKVIALYCRHPAKPETGFFAAYSYRGKAADTDIEAPAAGFIQGVNVPK